MNPDLPTAVSTRASFLVLAMAAACNNGKSNDAVDRTAASSHATSTAPPAAAPTASTRVTLTTDHVTLLQPEAVIDKRLADPEGFAVLIKAATNAVAIYDGSHPDVLRGEVDIVRNAAGTLAEIRGPNQKRIAFEYDALGRRVTKHTGTTLTSWLWDGNIPLQETTREGDGPPAVTTWVFEPGAFAPLGKVAPDGKKYSIITDYLGTPTEMYDEAGTLAWKAQLDIYGVPQMDVGKASDCPWRWPGQYADEDTGLYYNRFRYYDAGPGGYLSQDPLGMFGGLSVYGYVQDPLSQTDIFGLTCSSDAEELRQNMDKAGVTAPPYPNAAHHIVMSNSTDPGMAAARDHLASLGIGKNDAVNGVFLPRSTAAALASGTSAVSHSSLHGTNYKAAVVDRILSTSTKEGATAALAAIGQMLLGGARPGG